jgi:thymidylate kinase
MKIIIDGCDGTGKTTLIEKLADHYNCDVVRMMRNGSKEYFDYKSKYIEIENVIFDRSFMSEVVYSKVFNRTCRLAEFSFRSLFDVIKDIPTIILDCDPETIRERLLAKNEDPIIIDQIDIIRKAYIDLADEFHIPVIDTTKVSFEEIIERINLYENHK